MKINFIFHSLYGHIYKMAEAEAQGARKVAGAEVKIYQVPETTTGDVLAKMGALAAKKLFAHIPNKISILRRPAVVAKRRRLGDWEEDSIVSRKSLEAINILVERTSRMARLTRIEQKTAEATISAIKGALRIYPKPARKTITYDNGSENTGHEKVNHELGAVSYFCNPYHSWERGTVENTVGLVRRWLPKGTDFRNIKEDDIKVIERWTYGNRPKKRLKYKKPLEVFNELCYKDGKLGVALTG